MPRLERARQDQVILNWRSEVKLDRSYVFRITLLPEFREEFVLLQRGAAPQKFKQRILQFLGRLCRRLIRGFELVKIRDQRPRRNNQLRHSRRTLA